MKTLAKTALTIAFGLALFAQTAPDLFQQALRKEQVDGDLKGAMELYKRIAAEHSTNRPMAARALLHLGNGYEKLGAAEARGAYEKLVQSYADQASLASAAKDRLKALERNGTESEKSQPNIRMLISDKTDRWVPFGEANPSPNGRYLSYVNWSHGNLGMYDIETGAARDLTSEGTWAGNPDQFAWEGIWSPDNASVAYSWMIGPKGELRVVSREGGQPKVLVNDYLVPQAWTKDGKHIVALGPYRKIAPGKPEVPDAIMLVETASGKTNLVRRLASPHALMKLALSPDEKLLAYSAPPAESGSTNSGGLDIRIMGMDGSNDHALIEHPANENAPRWLPDGKHLLFLSDRSGEQAIWAARIERVDNGPVGRELRMLRASKSRNLGVADDGTVFFNEQAPAFNIYVAEADFGESTVSAPKLVSLRYDGKNRNPAWSADGQKLGFISWRSPAVLVLQDAVSGVDEEISTEWGFSDRPVWSPDLSRLVGPSKKPANHGNGLFNVDLKTRRRTVLAEPMDDCGWPVFTPDGKHLIYTKFSWSTNAPANQTIELDLATMQERVLSKDLASYNTPVAVSPDGSLLSACRNPYPGKDGDMIQLKVASRKDGATRVVAEFPFSNYSSGHVFGWAPDNRRVIVSLTRKRNAQQLHLVDIKKGLSTPFGAPLHKDEPIHSLSVHPDGKRIAFERGRMARELWAMKNFLEEKTATKQAEPLP